MYTNDISTGIGIVYSDPAAPIKVAFTVGVELMGTWVPDNVAQAYAARRVLQSVMATMCTEVEQESKGLEGRRISDLITLFVVCQSRREVY